MKKSPKDLAIVLAAGAGERIGGPKALLKFRKGESFLRRLERLFVAEGFEVRVVIGANAREVKEAHPSLSFIQNRRWREGMYSSVQTALRHTQKAKASGVFLHPVDMPLLKASTLRKMRKGQKGAWALVASYRGKPGHPLWLSPKAVRDILSLKSAAHLEAALEAFPVEQVSTRDEGVALNINTPQDYRRAFGRMPQKVC